MRWFLIALTAAIVLTAITLLICHVAFIIVIPIVAAALLAGMIATRYWFLSDNKPTTPSKFLSEEDIEPANPSVTAIKLQQRRRLPQTNFSQEKKTDDNEESLTNEDTTFSPFTNRK